jgi:hypothetical protein
MGFPHLCYTWMVQGHHEVLITARQPWRCWNLRALNHRLKLRENGDDLQISVAGIIAELYQY